jgi:hypothetical protein
MHDLGWGKTPRVWFLPNPRKITRRVEEFPHGSHHTPTTNSAAGPLSYHFHRHNTTQSPPTLLYSLLASSACLSTSIWSAILAVGTERRPHRIYDVALLALFVTKDNSTMDKPPCLLLNISLSVSWFREGETALVVVAMKREGWGTAFREDGCTVDIDRTVGHKTPQNPSNKMWMDVDPLDCFYQHSNVTNHPL